MRFHWDLVRHPPLTITHSDTLQDVITYEIVSLSPLSLEECVPGNGKLLGDMFMKGALADLIKRRVAGAAACPANVDNCWLDGEAEKAWNAISKAPIVRLTHPSWTHDVEVKHLDGQRPSSVVLSGPDVVEALRTTTGGILDLVQSQVNQVRLAKGCSPDVSMAPLMPLALPRVCLTYLLAPRSSRGVWLQSVPPTRAPPPIQRRHHEDGLRSGAWVRVPPLLSAGSAKFSYNSLLTLRFSWHRVTAIKDGAALAGVNRGFHPLASSGPLQSLLHQPHIIATAPVTVRKRVARYSYGFWDGNGPQNQITWFISKVRLDLSPFRPLPPNHSTDPVRTPR